MLTLMMEQSLQKAITVAECTILDYSSIVFCFIHASPISILSFHLFFFLLYFHQVVHSQGNLQKY